MAGRNIAVKINHSQTEYGKIKKGDEMVESKRNFIGRKK
jgi:hypothetical protein